MALATSIGMLSVVGFNLVDTFFIAQLGVEELAAISFSPTIIFSLSSLTIGLGIGLSVVISKATDKNMESERQKICTYSILLSLIFSCLFAVLGAATIDPVFSLLGASGAVLEHVNNYMLVWYLSMPLLVLPIVGNSAIRGIGNAKFPAMIMLFSSVMNLILDPILIFGLGPIEGMGIVGAAWASMVARLVSTLVAVYYLYHKVNLLTLSFSPMKEIWLVWQKVLRIAIPVGATRILTPLSMGGVTMIVAQHGDAAVAAFGVGSRIESVSMIFVTGLSVVIGPFIGQNLSNGLFDRIEASTNYGIKFCIIWGVFNALFFVVFAEHIGALFSDNSQVIEYSAFYMYIIPISLIGLACQIIASSICNPLGKPFIALKLSMIRMWAFCIPFVLIANYFGGGIHGIITGLLIANILSGAVAVITVKRIQNKVLVKERAKVLYGNSKTVSIS
ncbi:MATE family efflux transporter [uncultured Idiomarina sp.]|uniref:MATE family efflux transporter n=1 Tax=uncultured Idiomarina sp. TaxID=352961 RepID=UPI0025931AE9|nr:MATE family efflux transporter [uncultured Idiomarina sp.]